MEELALYRQELLGALEDVTGEISKIANRIPVHAWRTPVKLYSHTPHYTLAHFLALEEQSFGNQLHRIMEEDTPHMPVFDESAWMSEHYNATRPANEILDDFTSLRQEEIDWLRKLPAESWSRVARHPWWGLRTLQWWVELQLDYSHQLLRELAPS